MIMCGSCFEAKSNRPRKTQMETSSRDLLLNYAKSISRQELVS